MLKQGKNCLFPCTDSYLPAADDGTDADDDYRGWMQLRVNFYWWTSIKTQRLSWPQSSGG